MQWHALGGPLQNPDYVGHEGATNSAGHYSPDYLYSAPFVERSPRCALTAIHGRQSEDVAQIVDCFPNLADMLGEHWVLVAALCERVRSRVLDRIKRGA